MCGIRGRRRRWNGSSERGASDGVRRTCVRELVGLAVLVCGERLAAACVRALEGPRFACHARRCEGRRARLTHTLTQSTHAHTHNEARAMGVQANLCACACALRGSLPPCIAHHRHVKAPDGGLGGARSSWMRGGRHPGRRHVSYCHRNHLLSPRQLGARLAAWGGGGHAGRRRADVVPYRNLLYRHECACRD